MFFYMQSMYYSMSDSAHVYVHACMCVCACMRIGVYIHAVCMRMCVYTCCVYANMCVCTCCVNVNTSICICTRARVCVSMHVWVPASAHNPQYILPMQGAAAAAAATPSGTSEHHAGGGEALGALDPAGLSQLRRTVRQIVSEQSQVKPANSSGTRTREVYDFTSEQNLFVSFFFRCCEIGLFSSVLDLLFFFSKFHFCFSLNFLLSFFFPFICLLFYLPPLLLYYTHNYI